MTPTIKNEPVLRKILWFDALLDGVTAGFGLIFSTNLANWLGLPTALIVVTALITLSYGLLAVTLAAQKLISIPRLRLLIRANWSWMAVSVVLFFVHYAKATHVGIAVLVLQIIIVGGLAYVEGNQLISRSATPTNQEAS